MAGNKRKDKKKARAKNRSDNLKSILASVDTLSTRLSVLEAELSALKSGPGTSRAPRRPGGETGSKRAAGPQGIRKKQTTRKKSVVGKAAGKKVARKKAVAGKPVRKKATARKKTPVKKAVKRTTTATGRATIKKTATRKTRSRKK